MNKLVKSLLIFAVEEVVIESAFYGLGKLVGYIEKKKNEKDELKYHEIIDDESRMIPMICE